MVIQILIILNYDVHLYNNNRHYYHALKIIVFLKSLYSLNTEETIIYSVFITYVFLHFQELK